MKIISFHLRGKMAHFRKVYSNSSALSYTIPPRTTIIGIIAGLLGRHRDEYYEEFALDRCHVAVASCSSIKKNMQKLNLLMVKKANDFNGSAEYHSQTATEFIIPQSIRDGFIDYKIWLHHKDKYIMKEIEKTMVAGSGGYRSYGISIGLGTAFNLGWLENCTTVEGEEINEENDKPILSVIPSRKLVEILSDPILEGGYRLIKEEIPLEFDSQRCITERGLGNMVISLNSKPVPARMNSYIQLEDGNLITWME